VSDFVTCDGAARTPPPGRDLVPALQERVTLASTLANPDITLARAAATYILFKRKRLTESSERGYRSVLDEFTARHSDAKLSDFEPPAGAIMLEEFLVDRWGASAQRTYNKSLSILSDFFAWHVARGTLLRSPALTIERAKTRPVHRVTFTEAQVQMILATNSDPRDQIALRLLLHYGIRKGALLGIRFEHFDPEKRQLVVFTKGEKIHTLPIVDNTVWELLAQFDEPGFHYLLPKRTTRRRRPPQRKALARIADSLLAAREALVEASDDQACARELGDLLGALDIADARLALTVAAASSQTQLVLDEKLGEHGGHLWWYRCLARAGIVVAGTTAGRRMHSARHTAIQRVLDKTGNLKAAQVLAGHATVGTTGDIYSGWETAQLRETLRDVVGT
jgi:integrase